MKKKPLEIEFDGDGNWSLRVQETVKLYREGPLGELRTRERKLTALSNNAPPVTVRKWESGERNGAALGFGNLGRRGALKVSKECSFVEDN